MEVVRAYDFEGDLELLLRPVVEEALGLRSKALLNPAYEVVDAGRIHFPLEIHALFTPGCVVPATLGQLQEELTVLFARQVGSLDQLVELGKEYVLGLAHLHLRLLLPPLLVQLLEVGLAVRLMALARRAARI